MTSISWTLVMFGSIISYLPKPLELKFMKPKRFKANINFLRDQIKIQPKTLEELKEFFEDGYQNDGDLFINKLLMLQSLELKFMQPKHIKADPDYLREQIKVIYK
ncbi:hypothetical protein SNEBB_000411 [Seison nebaliae]|nr:hypothetical protein SNEBB_000411 [Seison nebaliae]